MVSSKTGIKRKATVAPEPQLIKELTRDESFENAFYEKSDSGDEASGPELTRRGTLKRRRGRKPKRPRTAAPVADDISDCEIDIVDRPVDGNPLNEKITIELYAHPYGPQLTVDLASVLATGRIDISNLLRDSHFRIVPAELPMKRTQFIDLPCEIHTIIYREIFVTKDRPIFLRDRKNFSRSAQILRTCRRVHEEGTSVLYGQNSFHFIREHHNRGTYYEPILKEVGYKDARHFLNDIGPKNMAKLRYVSFEFEDAIPTTTQYLEYADRKYFNDGVLIEILKMLAKHTELYILSVGFRGKAKLTDGEYHFLKALCSIRCHAFISDTVHGLPKIDNWVVNKIRRLVEIPPDPDTDLTTAKFVPVMYKDKGYWP